MSKGQISYIVPIFTLLLAGVLAGTMAIILPGQVTRITPQVEANEFENRAILLANSLLGNDTLIYSDGIVSYRGVFDVNKLNDLLFKKGSFTELYRCKPSESNCAINTYPGSYALIIITDVENNDGWFTGTNKLAGSGEIGQKILNCFMKTEMGTDGSGKLFDTDSDLIDVLELDKCNLRRHSNIMNFGFPISIRYSDGATHMGLLKVLVVE